MTRTTVTLPNPLHQRLRMMAKSQAKTLSEVASDLLDKALTMQEAAQIKKTYTVLKKMDGIGPKGISDASTMIDTMLYGDNG